MNVELVEMKKNDFYTAYKMHFIGFVPTFIKYKDCFNNPIFRTPKKFKSYFNSENLFMYFIKCNDIFVGQIWISENEDKYSISRLFVLKKFQNQGIATMAILKAEQLFVEKHKWYLDTIKEEKNNCHLYEKLGYKKIGIENKINKRMTIIEYEKEIE